MYVCMRGECVCVYVHVSGAGNLGEARRLYAYEH